jgi:hypothetical protein
MCFQESNVGVSIPITQASRSLELTKHHTTTTPQHRNTFRRNPCFSKPDPPSRPAVPVFRAVKRTILLISLPVSIIISTIYWSLMTLAPDLIVPSTSTASATATATATPIEPTTSKVAPSPFRIPFWIDVSLHAVPVIALSAGTFFLFLFQYPFVILSWPNVS